MPHLAAATAVACRLPDSLVRLQQLLLQRLAQPFAWGVRDCAMLAFDAALVQTGRDPAPDLRGVYCTAVQALRLLRDLGGLHGLLATRFGPRLGLWSDAEDGDIVLLSSGVCTGAATDQGALGLYWQGNCLGQGDAGLMALPQTAARGVWRVA